MASERSVKMNNGVRTNDYLHRLEKIIVFKPWLLPFIVYLSRNPMGTISTISRLLGVKPSIVRRALWWLSKTGIVKISHERGKRSYQVEEEALNSLENITRKVRYHDRAYVLKLGNEYILVRVRRDHIIPYTIPVEITSKIERILREAPNQEFTINDLILSMNIPARLLVQALRVLKILDIIEKKEKVYVLKK